LGAFFVLTGVSTLALRRPPREDGDMADDEMWDVTDVQGTPTGTLHRRGDGPVPAGSFHIVASVCVAASTGRVLVSRRAEGKDYPLAWEFPAGSALRGESSRRGAIRELDEEVGISVLPDDLVLVGRVVEDRALFDLWSVHVIGEPAVVVDPAEVLEAEWVDLDEVRHRWEAGVFATPWNARFEQLWDELEVAVQGEP
jgi:8-oxo-dGTP pyrophosphatase MutT (NUDIX family)